MQLLIAGIEKSRECKLVEGNMKKLSRVVVLILAIVIMLFIWSWFSSKKELAAYVQKVQPGMQVTEARSYAGQMGLKYVAASQRGESDTYRDLVTSTGVMGRYVCEIQHDGTVVVKVTSTLHD
jgi:hypothetical protein